MCGVWSVYHQSQTKKGPHKEGNGYRRLDRACQRENVESCEGIEPYFSYPARFPVTSSHATSRHYQLLSETGNWSALVKSVRDTRIQVRNVIAGVVAFDFCLSASFPVDGGITVSEAVRLTTPELYQSRLGSSRSEQ